jgi:hypothetical protein
LGGSIARSFGGIGWSEASGRGPIIGSFPPEGWLFIFGTLAFLKRNGGLFCPDYALKTEICDMTINPWQMNDFNGIFCWDALHHNTIKNIKTTIDIIYNSLVGGGLFMASLVSIHSGRTEKGKQIEPNTYINDQGLESGVPHHYFDEQEIRSLFQSYKILILAEIIANYIETEDRFYENNPFAYTKWNLLLMKEP